MKGVRALLVSLIIIFSLAAYPACAEAPIQLVVDGHVLEMDVQPQLIGGRVMIPARFLAEALGARVEWDQANQRVVITSKDRVASVESTVQAADGDRFVQLSVLAATYKISVTVVDKVTGAIRIDGQGHFAIFPARDAPDYLAVSDTGMLIRGRIVNGITLVDPGDLAAAEIIPSAANP